MNAGANGPWSGAVPNEPKARAPWWRRMSLTTLAYFTVSFLAVGAYAVRDLSQPEAWTYWKDLYFQSTLSSSVVPAAYPDSAGRMHPALAIKGEIGPAAAVWFRDRLRDAKFGPGDAVFLSSPGGNLDQALIIGAVIRAHGLVTGVGIVGADGRLKPSYCASACVMAYAGGTVRLGFPGSRLGVHRFTTSRSSDDSVADTQRTMGIVLGYMSRMGVAPSIVEAMSETRDIRWLGDASAVAANLITTPMDTGAR